MEIFNHLRRSFLVLTFILFALCMLILEPAWLGRMVEAWMESKPYPTFIFLPLMMTEGAPWYTQVVSFFTLISGIGIFAISGVLVVNPEITKSGKLILVLVIMASPILMPLVALIIGIGFMTAMIALVIYIICSITFSLLGLLTKEKLLLTTLAAILGAAINFGYHAFHPTQHSVPHLILYFFASGMLGSMLEYLWTSKWWQMDLSDLLTDSRKIWRKSSYSQP